MAKKWIYISGFTLLGILVQFLVHASIEMFYINLLITDFGHWGFGLSWRTWFIIHHFFTFLTLSAGILIGYGYGVYWWHRLYDKSLRHPVVK